ncbi:putative ribonuclease h protein [Quercus suber]|uniref:Ribonuclease h protein n=1 Tax=Quercus suber TaxID=58331 RepID=A0AAW0MCG9_QUESU
MGFPLKQPGSSSQDYNYILDRVKQKLAGWKANMLSLAGRTVLIQTSSVAIPAYVMQCSQLPCKVLDGIDRVNQNFLWGSSEGGKKIHWVGWQKVTKTKEEGGLGLQLARGRNTTLLAKLNSRLHTEREAPWAQVLVKKYCSPRRLNNVNANKLPCLATWKVIKKGMETFNKRKQMDGG